MGLFGKKNGSSPEVFGKLGVYSIYDSVGEQYAPPMLATTEAAALRDYASSIGKSPTPKDFSLIQLGWFNYKTGLLEAFASPRKIEVANTVEQPIIV